MVDNARTLGLSCLVPGWGLRDLLSRGHKARCSSTMGNDKAQLFALCPRQFVRVVGVGPGVPGGPGGGKDGVRRGQGGGLCRCKGGPEGRGGRRDRGKEGFGWRCAAE